MVDLQSRKNRAPFLLDYSCAIRKARYGNVTYATSISVRINQTTKLYEILKAYRTRCDMATRKLSAPLVFVVFQVTPVGLNCMRNVTRIPRSTLFDKKEKFNVFSTCTYYYDTAAYRLLSCKKQGFLFASNLIEHS